MNKILLVILLSVPCFFFSYSDALTGSGAASDPYELYDCLELQSMNTSLSSHYELKQNIDCSMTSTWNGGLGFVPVGNNTVRFTGSFNGNGYKIKNLYINRPSEKLIGLFGRVNFPSGTSYTIRNVELSNVDITGNETVGGLVGYVYSPAKETKILNIAVSGKIQSSVNLAGGIAGNDYQSIIQHSYSTADVSGRDLVGGLVGSSFERDVVLNSYSTGKVIDTDSLSYIGGLVGQYASGTYSSTTSYWDVDTSGVSYSAGAEVGKTSSEMKRISTYTGWDFSTIWGMDPNINNGYPYLRGLLSSDFGISFSSSVSSFPSFKIDGAIKNLSASLGTISIRDYRDNGTGWNLSVEATPFRNTTNTLRTFPSGSLVLDGGVTVQRESGSTQMPLVVHTLPVPIDSGSVKVLSMTNGYGTGEYTVIFPVESLLLSVDTSSVYSGNYTCDLLWTISSGP